MVLFRYKFPTTGQDWGYTRADRATVTYAPTSLQFGGPLATAWHSILRVPSVSVPPEAIITSSYFFFWKSSTTPAVPPFIKGFLQANAEEVSGSDSGSSSVTAYSASVPTTSSNDYVYADVSRIIEDLIAQPGWASGNAMKFRLSSTYTGGTNSYMGSGGGASTTPQLDIRYELPTPPVQTVLVRKGSSNVPGYVHAYKDGSLKPVPSTGLRVSKGGVLVPAANPS